MGKGNALRGHRAERGAPFRRANRSLVAVAFLGICGAFASPVAAQTTEVPEQEFALWNAVLMSASLSREAPGPSLWLDVHSRRGEAGTVLIVRPGVGLRATSWLSIWGGYAWVPVFDDASGRRADEHRVWQQAILTHTNPSNVSFQSRTRLEQRFGGGGDDIGHRVREFVRVGWKPNRSPVGLVVWDELFVGLNDVTWGPKTGYDQNRLFAGIAIPIAPWARLEMGYLLAHLNRMPNRIVHAGVINLFVSPKLAEQN